MEIFGWTFDQWAIALGHYKSMPTNSMLDFLHVKKKWKKSFPYDPTETLITKEERNKDWGKVEKLIKLVP